MKYSCSTSLNYRRWVRTLPKYKVGPGTILQVRISFDDEKIPKQFYQMSAMIALNYQCKLLRLFPHQINTLYLIGQDNYTEKAANAIGSNFERVNKYLEEQKVGHRRSSILSRRKGKSSRPFHLVRQEILNAHLQVIDKWLVKHTPSPLLEEYVSTLHNRKSLTDLTWKNLKKTN